MKIIYSFYLYIFTDLKYHKNSIFSISFYSEIVYNLILNNKFSAGCGRTGTIIAANSIRERINKEVNIFYIKLNQNYAKKVWELN